MPHPAASALLLLLLLLLAVTGIHAAARSLRQVRHIDHQSYARKPTVVGGPSHSQPQPVCEPQSPGWTLNIEYATPFTLVSSSCQYLGVKGLVQEATELFSIDVATGALQWSIPYTDFEQQLSVVQWPAFSLDLRGGRMYVINAQYANDTAAGSCNVLRAYRFNGVKQPELLWTRRSCHLYSAEHESSEARLFLYDWADAGDKAAASAPLLWVEGFGDSSPNIAQPGPVNYTWTSIDGATGQILHQDAGHSMSIGWTRPCAEGSASSAASAHRFIALNDSTGSVWLYELRSDGSWEQVGAASYDAKAFWRVESGALPVDNCIVVLQEAHNGSHWLALDPATGSSPIWDVYDDPLVSGSWTRAYDGFTTLGIYLKVESHPYNPHWLLLMSPGYNDSDYAAPWLVVLELLDLRTGRPVAISAPQSSGGRGGVLMSREWHFIGGDKVELSFGSGSQEDDIELIWHVYDANTLGLVSAGHRPSTLTNSDLTDFVHVNSTTASLVWARDGDAHHLSGLFLPADAANSELRVAVTAIE